ncbi:hypothetical protein MU852_03580 [Brevundimonas albigilva]|uniref:hypothetical protein n=1 Tax=Brevundimonas albigilva TaxID=1312364 RepID=UPI00201B82B6|nr:hypothetical protein [Brevundimonas albigilva]UQV18959.1 hypothetical protein MU852_03580 [Brevundimonas albigilva]
MTDATSGSGTPEFALEALLRHVSLTRDERDLVISFIRSLEDAIPGRLGPDGRSPVVALVASQPFGEALAFRTQRTGRPAALAFVHLMMDRRRLRRVIEQAGLRQYFATFDWD